MTASGYTGSVTATYDLKFDSYSVSTLGGGAWSISGGLTAGANGNLSINVNQTGTLQLNPKMDVFENGSNFIARDSIPSAAVKVFGLDLQNTTATGTSINSSGLFSWTPTSTGTFTFQPYVDVTFNGKTVRFTWPVITAVVS